MNSPKWGRSRRTTETTGTTTATTAVTSIPFHAGREGYASFRIPAVVVTRTPTLLAFREGRVDSAADHGHIDIVLKRSTDGGRTRGPLQAVARNGNDLAGNPAPVVLDTGRILLVHVRAAAGATEDAILHGRVKPADGRRVWVRHSDDEGVTWSAPKEITGQVKKADRRWCATTPGHALQLGTGRVVVPGNHSLPPTGTDTGTEAKYNSGHCLLSDDRGETWSLGYIAPRPRPAVVLGARRPRRPRPDDRPRLRRRRHHLAARAHGRRAARRVLRPRPCRRGDRGAPLRDGRLRAVRDDHLPTYPRDGPHLSRRSPRGGNRAT